MAADVAFLALAKDCRDTLPHFVDFIRALRRSGMRCVAFVGENGSTDGSAEFLAAVERAGELVVVATPMMSATPDRLQRMALGREHLKNALAGSGIDVAYVCVADTDNVMRRPPSVDAFRQALAKLQRPELFGVSATSHPHYYDLLAYEDDGLSFEHLAVEIKAHQTNLLAYYRFFTEAIYPHQRALTSDRERLCRSAFNGMCVYAARDYHLGSYLATGDDGVHRPEHVVFNRALAAATGRKMLVDPGLVLETPDDHRQKRLAAFAWQRLRKAVQA